MAKSKPSHQVVTKWKLADLKDHPRQAELLGDVSDADLAALARNMKQRGQRDPVHVTPDGTVVAGHQCVRAAELLGWDEVDAVVRHDLASGGDAAVEAHFIEDNFARRQLSPLARARCLKRLMELEEGRAAARFDFMKRDELKRLVASRMGLSARSASRYLLLLDAPAAVQQAFDDWRLTLAAANRVALLPKAAQAEVARRIELGWNPASAVASLAGGNDADSLGQAFTRLVSCLRREIPAVRGRAAEVRPERRAKSEQSVREAIEVLGEFLSSPRPPSRP